MLQPPRFAPRLSEAPSEVEGSVLVLLCAAAMRWMPLRGMRFMAMGSMVPRFCSVHIHGTDQQQ